MGEKVSKAPMRLLKCLLAVVVLVFIVYFGFMTVVREGSCVVILRFGAPRATVSEAGLYFRLPWPFESVVTYENRLQHLESNYLETTTKDKRNIILQSYVLWQVEDPLLFHNSVGSTGKVDTYIKDQIFSATNSVMGAYNLSELVSDYDELDPASVAPKTDEIQEKIFALVKENCESSYGIRIVNVSILRVSLPDVNLQSVFDQMTADRQKDINTILSEAEAKATGITSEADRLAAELVAQGTAEAAKRLAEAEAAVAKIYADAQAANLDLFRFLQNLDTMVASVNSGTVLIVNADTYPFNVLSEYSDYVKEEDGEQIIHDLEYILTLLPKEDRDALIEALGTLFTEYSKKLPLDSSETGETGTTAG